MQIMRHPMTDHHHNAPGLLSPTYNCDETLSTYGVNIHAAEREVFLSPPAHCGGPVACYRFPITGATTLDPLDFPTVAKNRSGASMIYVTIRAFPRNTRNGCPMHPQGAVGEAIESPCINAGQPLRSVPRLPRHGGLVLH